MSTSKTQCLAPFLKIYKRMKIIIIENIYSKFIIVNGSIKYVENLSFTNSKWIQRDITMHPPINVLVNFNNFIEKNIKLQNIKLEGLLKNVIPIIPISRNLQYHHHILESNTSKTFTINRYQLSIAPTFSLTNFKTQGQTFDNLIIDLQQPLDNVRLNMDNIYVTLSCLQSIDGLIVL
jgi:ATP-dependent exoDNAse (exonuclease V) alpha subunit